MALPLSFRREVNNPGQNCADDHPQQLIPIEEWNTAKRRLNSVEQWRPQYKNVLDHEEQVPPAPRALILRSVHLGPPWLSRRSLGCEIALNVQILRALRHNCARKQKFRAHAAYRPAAGSHKFGVERDLGVENLRYRAVFFRFASHLCKCRLI